MDKILELKADITEEERSDILEQLLRKKDNIQ